MNGPQRKTFTKEAKTGIFSIAARQAGTLTAS